MTPQELIAEIEKVVATKESAAEKLTQIHVIVAYTVDLKDSELAKTILGETENRLNICRAFGKKPWELS